MMADDLRLTDTQRNVLAALCRPAAGGNRFAPPATNQEIADELFLSVDAIKAHLRVLFRKFGIEDLPHNQKRARLVELALERGVVSAEGVVVGAETPAHPVPSTNPEVLAQKQGRRPSGRLIAAGAAVGIVAVLILVLVLTSGGGNGEKPTPAEFVKGVNSACSSAVKGTGVTSAKAVPSPDGLLSAITNVRSAIEDLGSPSGGAAGLSSFSVGLDKAGEALREISNDTVTDSAATFGGLTVASGLIQVGTAKLRLGAACARLSVWVGATQIPPGT